MVNVKKERFSNLSNRLSDIGFVFYTYNKDLVFTYVNDCVSNILGYSAQEFLTDFTIFLTNSPINHVAVPFAEQCLSGETVLPYELEVIHKDGRHIIIEVFEIPFFDEDGNVVEVEGMFRDITEIVQTKNNLILAKDEILKHKQMLEEAQQLAHIGSWYYDIITGQLKWSDEVYRIFGFTPQSFDPDIENFYSYLPDVDRIKVQIEVQKSLDNPGRIYEVEHLIKNGKYVKERGHVLQSEQGKIVAMIGTVQDITKEYEYNKEIDQQKENLRYQAYHDPLTGLPNRLMFTEQLDTAIEYSRRHKVNVAVFFIDLDNFKMINDSLGHDSGDIVLKNIANRLKDALRSEDLVFRLGGDEFTIILFDVETPHSASAIGNKILKVISEPISINEQNLYVSSSIGISLYPQDGTDSQTLIKNADTAMYKAKDSGRNTLEFYTSKMTEVAFERMLMETNLKRAIANDEFTIYYQPQYEVHSNQIIGCEALVRWVHPEMGIISPALFIPIAEESNLIMEIGELVFRKACIDVTRWRNEGNYSSRVSVNISGMQINSLDIVKRFQNIMDETGCKPEFLELEVTENFIMKNYYLAKKNLYLFKNMGIRLSIDDFGTGYSSLQYLKQLPVSILKIDKGFVRDINRNDDDKAIIRAIIALSKSLSLLTIAEGVETDKQLEFLKTEGADYIQGFLYSKPLLVLEFEKLINKKRSKNK